jgi:hypothetical protein
VNDKTLRELDIEADCDRKLSDEPREANCITEKLLCRWLIDPSSARIILP